MRVVTCWGWDMAEGRVKGTQRNFLDGRTLPFLVKRAPTLPTYALKICAFHCMKIHDKNKDR